MIRLNSEGDVKLEREWRLSLQSLVDDQQEQITALKSDVEALQQKIKDFDQLKIKKSFLEKKCADYELSLEEMGAQLQE